MELKVGDLIFYKNIPSFLSRVQQWYLKTIYSHVSIFSGTTEMNLNQEFDADLRVRFHTFRGITSKRDVFRFKDVSYDVLWQSTRAVADLYEGELYGFISWLTIAIRHFFKRLGFKNTRSWNILWGWGVICSELLYYFVEDVSGRMMARGLPLWDSLWLQMRKYNPNTFTPQDLGDIINNNPECFETIFIGGE